MGLHRPKKNSRPNWVNFRRSRHHPKLKYYFHESRSTNKKICSADVAKTTKSALRTKAFGLLAIIADDLGLKRPANYGPGFVGKWLRTTQEQNRLKYGTGYYRWSPSGKRNTTRTIVERPSICLSGCYGISRRRARDLSDLDGSCRFANRSAIVII